MQHRVNAALSLLPAVWLFTEGNNKLSSDKEVSHPQVVHFTMLFVDHGSDAVCRPCLVDCYDKAPTGSRQTD